MLVRWGFQTNSSSSHAVALRDRTHDRDRETHNFGWQNFICQSRHCKTLYFFQQVMYNVMREDRLQDLEAAITKYAELFAQLGIPLPYNLDYEVAALRRDLEEFYIDHQSAVVCPKRIEDGSLDIEFLMSIIVPLVQDDSVVILGGNDNDDIPRFYIPHPAATLWNMLDKD